MQYGHIVSMIDTCLERLHAARQLLSTPNRSSVVADLIHAAEAGTAKTKKKVRPQISKKKKRIDELTASLFAPVEAGDAVAPVMTEVEIESGPILTAIVPPIADVVPKQPVVAVPRRRLVTREHATPSPRKKVSASPGALVGHVPSGPVFIPAAQVPQVRPKVRLEEIPRQSESSPLTAELLAQRWIQNAGF